MKFLRTLLRQPLPTSPLPDRPRRIVLETAMSREEIERVLGGTDGSPQMRAVVALVTQALVDASDRATGAPVEPAVVGNQIYSGFTPEMRTYAAGGAEALANILAELQAITAERETPKVGKPAKSSSPAE